MARCSVTLEFLSASEADRCPRCGSGLHCGVRDAAPCACTTVSLPAALQARLRERYAGCLCLACLRALAAKPDQALRSTTLPTE